MPPNYWDDNGDLVVIEKTTFRQVGWLIHGGDNDGLMVKEVLAEHKAVPMGGFYPVYIEVGD